MTLFELAGAVILAILILRRPYLGVVFTIASLPIVQVLPRISLLNSVASLIGGITIIGFLGKRIIDKKPILRLNSVLIISFFFIIWIYLSDPEAAWSGIDRNWVFTFFQLWLLVWLSGELLDSPEKHHVLMWIYSICAVFSALAAMQQGKIGVDIFASERTRGFAQDENIAAQYFIVGALFLNYFRTISDKQILRLLTIGGMIITFAGIFFTISRTGIILIFMTVGLLILVNPNLKYRIQIIAMFSIGLLVMWFISDNIVNIVRNIMPAITQGTDTAGLRYAFWRAGWKMWLTHPVQGVGIGMYRWNLVYFLQDIKGHKTAVAHNMYIQILAETGLVGFALFVLLIYVSLRSIFRQKANHLRDVWLIVSLVMLLGGVTLSSQYDKLIWVTFGISTYFSRFTPLSVNASEKEIIRPSERKLKRYG